MKLQVEFVNTIESIWQPPTAFAQGTVLSAKGNGRVYLVGKHYQNHVSVSILIRLDDGSGYSAPVADYYHAGETFREVKAKLTVDR
jgi:hypothetical protein